MIGKHPKPLGCATCPLEHQGVGYVPGIGPVGAHITILSEAPGYDEVAQGAPMVGAAGGMLTRILKRTFRTREQFRIENTLRCCPPQYEIKKEWAEAAAAHCSQYSAPILAQSPVIFAMGGTAIRRALNLWDWDIKNLVNNFHGTVHDLPSGQKVVCSYHPSFLQRGASNLIGTVAWDLSVAEAVAAGTWQRDLIEPIVDPHPEWVRHFIALYRAALQQNPFLWLDIDIETPDKAKGKAEDELDESDASFQIDRVNFAMGPDQGFTVPYVGEYILLIHELIELAGTAILWNGDYDLRRLAKVGALPKGEIFDGMWIWHHYKSDVPRGLGFAAPYCSNHGAWKHLFTSDPGTYAAYDGPQTHRTTARTIEALEARGQWEVAYRHTVRLMQQVLKPAQVVGIQVDRPELDRFETDLTEKLRVRLSDLQACIPADFEVLTGGARNQGLTRPPTGAHPDATTLTNKGVVKKGSEDADPLKLALYAEHAKVVERRVVRKVLVCDTCGELEVVARHRCKGKDQIAAVQLREKLVTRWFWKEPFNPDSPLQVLGYMHARKHKPGRNKKTKGDSADREALTRLAATTKDPFYLLLLEIRGISKVRGTYAIGVRKRLDADNRFHPTPTLKPSTLRTSYVAPNIQNVVSDRGGPESLAAGFRRCIVASPGCTLVEIDYAGIEARQVGWFARDKDYYRLAGLGVHAYLASHLIKRPADLSWSDEDLLTYFKEIKKGFPAAYTQAKRTVHGNGYGMTPKGMWLMFPELYANEAAAKKVQDLYFDVAPAVPKWQNAVKLRAWEQTYIGGPPKPYHTVLSDPNAHPYGYRHDFYSVVAFRKVGPQAKVRMEAERIPLVELSGNLFAAVAGEDSKRSLSFYPQSTASGNLKETALTLYDPEVASASYIGDVYYGTTPLRAPIHDSLLNESPDRALDRVLECLFREMLRPIEEQPLPADWHAEFGPYLTIGVECKVGRNWEQMEVIPTPTPASLGLDLLHYQPEGSLAFDRTYFPPTEDEEEDVQDLGIVVELQ